MTQLHPVLGCVAELEAALKGVADVDPAFMPTEDKAAALLALTRLVGRVEELRGRVLASADDVAAEEGARDAAAWLAHHARLDVGHARAALRLDRAGVDRWQALARARREGEVTTAQAETIRRALADLPADLDIEVRLEAEARLVAEAARFGPRQLRILGRRVLDVVSPELADSHEGQLLEREDARAARTTYLTTRRNGDGTTDLRVRVSDSLAQRLLTYLEAFTAPRVSGDDRRPYDQRLGAAFGTFLEAIDPRRLPLHGGDATTVIVTVDLEVLRGGLGSALIGDEPISAGEARRLACQAKVVPAVLGGDSELLDLGRSRRLFQPHQRKALAVSQPTCRAVGCTIPAAWCEAHHGGVPWAEGGRTDLAEGVLLCAFHHHRAHDHHYRTERQAEGSVLFHRQR
jgi:hypothetical protein